MLFQTLPHCCNDVQSWRSSEGPFGPFGMDCKVTPVLASFSEEVSRYRVLVECHTLSRAPWKNGTGRVRQSTWLTFSTNKWPQKKFVYIVTKYLFVPIMYWNPENEMIDSLDCFKKIPLPQPFLLNFFHRRFLLNEEGLLRRTRYAVTPPSTRNRQVTYKSVLFRQVTYKLDLSDRLISDVRFRSDERETFISQKPCVGTRKQRTKTVISVSGR